MTDATSGTSAKSAAALTGATLTALLQSSSATTLAAVAGAVLGVMHARLNRELPDDADCVLAEQLLQLLGLILALLAIAKPDRAGEGGSGQRLIILIDRSASMASVDAGANADESRLDDAKEQALALISDIRASSPE